MTNEQLREVESWYNDLLRATLKGAHEAERNNNRWVMLECYDTLKGYHIAAEEVFKINADTCQYFIVRKAIQSMMREMRMEKHI